jgi:ADP-ribose pyrophosphatase YjhB (NUDIX family)
MITAQVVLINEEGLILAVSRKDNHNDMGLPGGKMDLEDNMDPMVTAIRECKEETGLDVYDLKLVFAIHKSGNMGYTYLAKYSGEINHNEPHVVKWLPMQPLINGKFGRYNQMVCESLEDMGVNFVKKFDKQLIADDVAKLITEHYKGYYKLDELHETRDFMGNNIYSLYLVVTEDETEDVEETFDYDDGLGVKLDELNKKYYTRISLDSGHYSK